MGEQVIRPGVPASGRVTPASFPFFTSGEDNLRVTSWNAAAGVQLKINGRLLSADGRPNADSWDHTPNTDRSAKATDITLSGSTLLNITVFASAGAPLLGQTFVLVQLIRGVGTAALVLGTILQGYVTNAQAIGFPGSAIQTSLDGGGYIRSIVGTQPAAGAEIAETVPAGARWQLLTWRSQLTTSATVITRRTLVGFTSGGALQANTYIRTANMVSIAASSVVHTYYAQGLPLEVSLDNSTFTAGLPVDVPLLAGSVILTSTNGLQPGDQWGAPLYLIREWLEP